ncbi:pyridoxal phosphate-dependent aminotransferase [Nitrosopumilus sp.]|jgi:aspartate/methionine/tyrosine aminotransferase|nr:pyridoxal phosphate-dependent aminotransferase [Nitrosopumilus sp.]
MIDSHNLSKKVKTLKRKNSPIKEIMNYGDPEHIRKFGINPEDLISFAGGWSNHKAPENLRKAYESIIADTEKFHSSGAYSTSIGDREFRNTICKFENYLYEMELDEKQIAVGLGSTQLTNDLFSVLLDPGDKILLLDPSYCNYQAQLVNVIPDIEIKHFSVIDEEKWEFNADNKIEEFSNYILQNKPKIVMLVSPDNPTSKILSQEFVQATLDAVKEIDSYLIMDFAYKELVYNNVHPEYFSWSPSDNFISLRTNSKWCRSLGRRIGWIEAPENVVEAMEFVQSSTILSPDKLHQMAFGKFINESIEDGSLNIYLEKTRKLYKNAAEKTVEIIKKHLDFPVIQPDGGLYVFMDVKTNSAKFVETILRNTGVLVIPGWGFGRTGTNAVRVSFGPLVDQIDKIEQGIMKISKYLKETQPF